MVAAGKKFFGGIVGLGVFGVVGKAVYASGDLIGAGVAGLALIVAAYLVISVIPDDPPAPPSTSSQS